MQRVVIVGITVILLILIASSVSSIRTTAQSDTEVILATTQAQLESQKKLTQAYRLAAHSQSLSRMANDTTLYPSETEGMPRTTELSALLAIESLRQSPTIEGDIALRQVITQLRRKPFVTQASVINEVVFSPDSRLLATRSEDNTVRLWDAINLKDAGQISHEGPVHFLSFSNDGKWLATASEDDTAKILDMKTGQILSLRHNGAVNHLAFSPDNEYLATASGDNAARIWKVRTGEEIVRLEHKSVFTNSEGKISPQPINFVAFNTEGQLLATASDDSTARIWNVTSGEEVARFEYEPFSPSPDISFYWRVNKISFSSNSQFLITQAWAPATVERLEQTILWEVSKKQEFTRTSCAEFSPDGDKVILCGNDGISNYQLSPKKLLWTWETKLDKANYGGYVDVVFNAEGNLIAVKKWNPRYYLGYVSIVDAESSELKAFLSHNGSFLLDVAFSPDSQWVATRSKGFYSFFPGNPNWETKNIAKLQLWDIKTEREVARFVDDIIQDMDFSSDGRWLAIACGKGNIYLLPLQQKDLIDYACSRLPKNLTQLEWKQYVSDEPYHATCANLPIPEK